MNSEQARVDFEKPAILRKWPSLGNERQNDRSPYVLFDGSLDQCVQELIAKPETTRHLYEIKTEPQPPLVSDVLPGAEISELARFRGFL